MNQSVETDNFQNEAEMANDSASTLPSLTSQLSNVSDELWTEFVSKMVTAKTTNISENNALGMFELTPRRLEDTLTWSMTAIGVRYAADNSTECPSILLGMGGGISLQLSEKGGVKK